MEVIAQHSMIPSRQHQGHLKEIFVKNLDRKLCYCPHDTIFELKSLVDSRRTISAAPKIELKILRNVLSAEQTKR